MLLLLGLDQEIDHDVNVEAADDRNHVRGMQNKSTVRKRQFGHQAEAHKEDIQESH